MYLSVLQASFSGYFLDFVVISGVEAKKPLCMIGIPSDGTINTISVQAITTTPRPGPGTSSGTMLFSEGAQLFLHLLIYSCAFYSRVK